MYNVRVTAEPVILTLERNNVLNVFPFTRKLISSALLSSKSSDENRAVSYVIRNRPLLGKIIMETSEGVLDVNRFTQKDINDEKVFYEHTGQFVNLSSIDSFTFDVEAHFVQPLANQVSLKHKFFAKIHKLTTIIIIKTKFFQLFKIQISVSSGGLDRYVVGTPVEVKEGGSAEVRMNISGIVKFLQTKSGIANPTVLTKLIAQPSHGHVMLRPDLNVTSFTQSQIESGEVWYYHDDSDTLQDQIALSFYLLMEEEIYRRPILLSNTSLPVKIAPVNDKLFKLVTLKPSITVVRNQNQTITRDNLLTEDLDTSPDEIVYDVISGPFFGRLLLLSSDRNSSEVRRANKFTQQDIDANRLIYEHSGPLQETLFYFRVWDGQFNHHYDVLKVHVLPINLNVTVLGPVYLPQGSSVAVISEDTIQLDTNARQELISYNVTSQPRYGKLYLRDTLVTSFRHADLLSKSIIFMQVDMTVSNDSFELVAQLSDFRVENIVIEIKVKPLMTVIKPMFVYEEKANRITLQNMDATPLAELTSSNPQYIITRKPKYAKVKRITKSTSSSGERRGTREKEVSRFSHQDVVSGVIYLICKQAPRMTYEGLPDNFSFVLAAPHFQPAQGVFDFRLKFNTDAFNNTIGGPMDPVGHEGEMTIAPNMTNDYLLVLAMLCFVFLLGIVVIMTIRCRHNRYKHAEEDKIEADPPAGVMPLPRPPDHLMPTTPYMKRFCNDHNNLGVVQSSTPLPSALSTLSPMNTSTLPQCKVTPLGPLESLAGSDVEASARYPYGVPDGDEWSSFDTSEMPCQSSTTQRSNPLLRRNQYWV